MQNGNKAAEDAAAWREISPYLDAALDLEADARERWLRQLEEREPLIGARVKSWLEERARLEAEGFLSDRPTALLQGHSLAGEQLGAYTLESPLGRGGMGTVWYARRSDGRFEGHAAVKLLNAALVSGPAGRRFEREGSVLATLQHPNIAHLLDAGIAPGGQPYLVLEYVDGIRIDTYCEQQDLSVGERVRLFLDVMAAVAHAHRHLVVHRDLKPSNILVTKDGVVKLLDFGIAALLASPADAAAMEFTRETALGLTPEYAAPEQLLGQVATTSTDVYALGLVLFVLLTGRHPAAPSGKSAAELVHSILDQESPLPSRVAADLQRARALRGDLDNIVAKALKKQAGERYASVDEFARDLRCFLGQQPVSAHADSWSYRAGKFIRRHKTSVAGVAIAAILLLASAGFALIQMVEARRQRDVALEQTQRAEGFNSVITRLLSQTGPGGRALTPEELLDRAVVEVRERYAEDPRALTDMLGTLSGRYYDLRNTNKEYAVLLEAERAARKSGDPALLVGVHCDTVETELIAGRLSAARKRMQEVRVLLPQLEDYGAGPTADCLRAEAELANSEGDLPQALARLHQARKLLEADGRTWGNRYAGIVSMLGTMNAEAGRFPQAHEYVLEVVALDRRYERAESVAGIISRAALAFSFYRLGQVRRAERMIDEMPTAWPAEDSGTPLNASVASRFGEILSRTGRHEKALELLGSAVAQADAGGNRRLALRARLSLAQALLQAARVDDAQRTVDEASALLAAEERPYLSWAVRARCLQAEIDLARGDPEGAAREIATALDMLHYPADAANPLLAPVLLLNARTELMRNHPQDAVRLARASSEIFSTNTLDSIQSADVGAALLVLAEAEMAAGRAAQARLTAARAHETLNNAVGPADLLTGRAAGLLSPP